MGEVIYRLKGKQGTKGKVYNKFKIQSKWEGYLAAAGLRVFLRFSLFI